LIYLIVVVSTATRSVQYEDGLQSGLNETCDRVDRHKLRVARIVLEEVGADQTEHVEHVQSALSDNQQNVVQFHVSVSIVRQFPNLSRPKSDRRRSREVALEMRARARHETKSCELT
jgi:arginyl-tRNA synthetase